MNTGYSEAQMLALLDTLFVSTPSLALAGMRADLIVGINRLPLLERRVVVYGAMGYTDAEIGRLVGLSRQTTVKYGIEGRLRLLVLMNLTGEIAVDANEYQKHALRTASAHDNKYERMLNAALGLTGESGEVADLVKKARYHGHELPVSKLADELGDVLWYVALFADALGVTMAGLMALNIEKLARRYPEGFSSEASINRGE